MIDQSIAIAIAIASCWFIVVELTNQQRTCMTMKLTDASNGAGRSGGGIDAWLVTRNKRRFQHMPGSGCSCRNNQDALPCPALPTHGMYYYTTNQCYLVSLCEGWWACSWDGGGGRLPAAMSKARLALATVLLWRRQLALVRTRRQVKVRSSMPLNLLTRAS